MPSTTQSSSRCHSRRGAGTDGGSVVGMSTSRFRTFRPLWGQVAAWFVWVVAAVGSLVYLFQVSMDVAFSGLVAAGERMEFTVAGNEIELGAWLQNAKTVQERNFFRLDGPSPLDTGAYPNLRLRVEDDGRRVPFEAVTWLPPLADTAQPRTILALGLNYRDLYPVPPPPGGSPRAAGRGRRAG